MAITARSAADLLEIQANSAALFYRKIREVIVYYLEQEAPEIFGGAIALDESYFGGVRKGKRRRGAAGKGAVFGILKRGWQGLYQGSCEHQSRALNAAASK